MRRVAPPLAYAWYHAENVALRGEEVLAWGAGLQQLRRTAGRVTLEKGIVRLERGAALQRVAADWGTLESGYTILARVQLLEKTADGPLCRSAVPNTPPIVALKQGRWWADGLGQPATFNRWQTLAFLCRPPTTPLAGFLLGGVACALAELQVFDHPLTDAERRDALQAMEGRGK